MFDKKEDAFGDLLLYAARQGDGAFIKKLLEAKGMDSICIDESLLVLAIKNVLNSESEDCFLIAQFLLGYSKNRQRLIQEFDDAEYVHFFEAQTASGNFISSAFLESFDPQDRMNMFYEAAANDKLKRLRALFYTLSFFDGQLGDALEQALDNQSYRTAECLLEWGAIPREGYFLSEEAYEKFKDRLGDFRPVESS